MERLFADHHRPATGEAPLAIPELAVLELPPAQRDTKRLESVAAALGGGTVLELPFLRSLDAEELLRGLRESAAAAAAGDRQEGKPEAAESFLGRLGRAILDNLRITILRLSVRVLHRKAGETNAASSSRASGGGSPASSS